MRIKTLSFLIAALQVGSSVVAATACPCSQVTENQIYSAPKPTNHTAGLKFSDTEECKKEFASAIEQAKAACAKYIGKPNVAVVADIDETILDNREDYRQHPDWSWPAFVSWIKEAKAPTLKPTADFLAWARENGFAVFLITGRPEALRSATIENLVHDKIAYDGLYLRPDETDTAKVPPQIFKTEFRKKIEDMGFTVVENIGDQFSDLVGGHAEDCEKLPNQMYRVP